MNQQFPNEFTCRYLYSSILSAFEAIGSGEEFIDILLYSTDELSDSDKMVTIES